MSASDTKLSSLRLHPASLASLQGYGYETLGDIEHLTAIDLLRMPNIGGTNFRKIMKALGRDSEPSKQCPAQIRRD